MRTLTVSLVCVLLLSATPWLAAQELPNGVVNTQNPADISLTPLESLERLSVPPGCHATLFAGEPELRRPIAFDFDDRGRIWVVENYSHPNWKKDNASDRIVIYEDVDNDGQFDRRTVFWDKGRYLTGLAIGHGGVWVANTPELTFIADANHDDQPDGEPVAVLDGFGISTNNVVNNLHWGPDGWLYGAIGLSSKSLVGKPETAATDRVSITRGIWRFHPITHTFEKVAEGMVNPWGADFNEYGDLITSNTVIAHLWHIVPGMYCERRASERDNPYAYGRIQTIADHLHWGGGGWQSSRAPANQRTARSSTDNDSREAVWQQHSVAGGGHAHCGGMIYLGDNWPEQYRGSFFTNNLHGSRVNNDRLIPHRSSYTGIHSDDLLAADDAWFRGMSIKYGPDGGIYISDWHDFGECHDSDGSHRTSGRLFKFVFGQPDHPQADLQQLSSVQLAKLHLHPNAWFARRARRILHERSAAGANTSDAQQQLQVIFNNHAQTPTGLSALWTLHCLDALDDTALLNHTAHPSEHVRRWAVRFLVDDSPCDTSPNAGPERPVTDEILQRLAQMATSEESAKVRLEIACALQRLSFASRPSIAAGLLSQAQDATDPYLPLMIWYGMEPTVTHDVQAAMQLAVASQIPLVRQYLARRAIDQQTPAVDPVVNAIAASTNSNVQRDLLQGMLDGFQGRGSAQPPASWPALYSQLNSHTNSELRSVALQLAVVFGNAEAIQGIRSTLLDSQADTTERLAALTTLLPISGGVSVDLLHSLLEDSSELRGAAITALGVTNRPDTADRLLQLYASLSATEQQQAISVLTSRLNFAEQLLDAVNNDDVDRRQISAYALQQLKAFRAPQLQQRLALLWADDPVHQKAEDLAYYTSRMSPEYLQTADAARGRRVFQQTCAKCHTLFGEGGTIAPDLTGSGRKKSDYVLRNLIDPSAEVDAAYRLTTVQTDDGRLFSGFMIQQDDSALRLRTQDDIIQLQMKNVEQLVTSSTSMMPEGLLRNFSDEQVRDLLVYLASDDQIAVPSATD